MDDLKYDQKTHFKFGENWANFSEVINQTRIDGAEQKLLDLFGETPLKDKTFLDIGCGSGIHGLAALNSGVSHLTCIDFDPDSVKTTSKVLEKFGWNRDEKFKVHEDNILKPLALSGQFDLVYSWGVLHHTGDMWNAIQKASEFVGPEGYFAIAIYQKTRLCSLWKVLKKFYVNSPRFVQVLTEKSFSFLKMFRVLLTGKNPFKLVKDYPNLRGMSWHHDVKDWVGGYPYESATPEEIVGFFDKLGFDKVRTLNTNREIPIGLFGSGCGEFLFKKRV